MLSLSLSRLLAVNLFVCLHFTFYDSIDDSSYLKMPIIQITYVRVKCYYKFCASIDTLGFFVLLFAVIGCLRKKSLLLLLVFLLFIDVWFGSHKK